MYEAIPCNCIFYVGILSTCNSLELLGITNFYIHEVVTKITNIDTKITNTAV